MQNFGELIAISVAVSWTFTALFFEFAGKRIGSLVVNLLRLFFGFFLLGTMLYFTTGSYMPQNADTGTWIWMSLSGLVGFVFGDFCLFYSYTIITARFGQLLMTLAPPFAAFFGWLLLGEKLSPMGFVGMTVTLLGIAISVLKRGGSKIEDNAIVAGVSDMAVVTSKDEEEKVEKKGAIYGVVNGGKNIIGKLMPNVQLNLPLKGILLGIGAALGQGFGIVLSKIGMNHYSIAAKGTEVASYIPFAATQMRIISGAIGFAVIILITRRTGTVWAGIKDKKAMGATFMGAIFGPFVGVSLSLMAVQYTNTAIASTIMATTPIIILIPYILFYKKKITLVELAGAVLSVGGVALFFL
ncbi:MAG: EamA family transporter [Bacteroidales bacterium]